MIGRWEPRPATKPSPWLIGLLLLGSLSWLSPIVSAARRIHRTQAVEQQAAADDIVLTLQSTGDLCVRGTSIASSKPIALIGGQTVTVGEQVQLDGRGYRVTRIEPDQVRLRRLAETAAPGMVR